MTQSAIMIKVLTLQSAYFYLTILIIQIKDQISWNSYV